MFELIATLVFVSAAALSICVIATMFMAYHKKMVAALLFEPMPQTDPVYQVQIRRRRARPAGLVLQPSPVRAARAA